MSRRKKMHLSMPVRSFQKSTCDDDQDESLCELKIIDNIFLGSMNDASNTDVLVENKIEMLISLADICDVPDIECINYSIEDHSDADIETIFGLVFNDIISNSDKNILVVCRRGISRSATIVIGYLIAHYRYSFDDAFMLVKSKRSIINPNFGFTLFLEGLDETNIQKFA
jgi:protein-tyrosine phosphatase